MNELKFIAEISGNHKQQFEECIKLIDDSIRCGADYVKFQCYTPESLTIDCDNEFFTQKFTPLSYPSYYDLYKRSMTPREWFKDLFDYCKDRNQKFLVTPFSFEDLEFLEKLNCPHYKIAAYESLDSEFVKTVSLTKKPVYASIGQLGFTGALNIFHTLYDANKESTIFYSISKHPSTLQDFNFELMRHLSKYTYGRTGFSDHSIDFMVTLAAVMNGASIVEKHITRDKTAIDGHFSLNADEYSYLIKYARNFYKDFHMKLPDDTSYNRSIFCIKDIEPGEKFTRFNLKVIRPGAGIHPRYFNDMIGTKSNRKIKRGEPITMEDFNDRDIGPYFSNNF